MSQICVENICRSCGFELLCWPRRQAFAQAAKVADTPKGKAYVDAKE